MFAACFLTKFLFGEEKKHPMLYLPSLKHVTVVFRHGNRTPDSLWPKYCEPGEDFHPYGFGELTNEGKTRMYELGKSLRKYYSPLLGTYFKPSTVEARTSDWNRTKNSLSYVLAGLFPPFDNQIWNENFIWQAIPYHCVPMEDDKCFFGILSPECKQLLKDFQQTEEYKEMMKNHEQLLLYLEQKSGWNMKSYIPRMNIYYELLCMELLGIELPYWTEKIHPKATKELLIKMYHIISINDDLLKYAAGYLMKSILEEMEKVVMGKVIGRKINLYSGHEINVAFLLRMLDLFDDEPPDFGSYIIFELHETDQHCIRILHQNYKSEHPKVLTIPGCPEICPISLFQEKIKNRMPTKENLGKISTAEF